MDPPGPEPEVALPSDILLPLFALTLVANAFLVAAAIRGMLRARPDLDRPPTSGRSPTSGRPGDGAAPAPAPGTVDRPLTGELKQAIAARRSIIVRAPLGAAPPEPSPSEPAGPDPARPPDEGPGDDPSAGPPTPESTRPPAPAASSPGSAAATPPPATASPATPRRRRTTKAGASGEAGGPRPSETPRRARRRFSLPPDEDHEKVNRSIESFLGGIDGSAPDSGTAAPDRAGPTTVALVAVDGIAMPGRTPPATATPASSASDVDAGAVTDAGATDAVAMVERTLRGAARGSDVVSVAGVGRFQVILAGTGELAARAYLRRIRATVEPMLEASDRPLRLAVATATVLGEPIEDAVRQADRRLAAMLETARDSAGGTGRDDHEPGRDPRAAGD